MTVEPVATESVSPAAGSVQGLRGADAAARLARDAPTCSRPLGHRAPWRLLAAQMVHFFALMLWAAGVLAFIAGMPQLGGAIFVVVVINGVFAFSRRAVPSTPPSVCVTSCPVGPWCCGTANRWRSTLAIW